MEEKIDLRIIKTQRAIKEAFLELLKETSYHNITITAISNKAFINRKTFYAHYETKELLYEDIIRDALAVLSPTKILDDLDNFKDDEKKLEFTYQVLNKLKANGNMLSVLLSDNADGTFQENLKEQLSQVIISKSQIKPKIKGTPYDVDMICSIYFSTFFYVIKSWIDSDSNDPNVPIDLINRIFSREYLSILGINVVK